MSPRNWLRSWLPTAPRTPARRLAVEQLEAREVPSAVAPPSGLVSWWTADNTAADLKGLNNATLINGATYAAGVVGQAFSLDGVNDRVNMPDSASLSLSNSLSIEGWVLIRAVPTTQHGEILFRGDDRGGLDPYQLRVEPSGSLTFQVQDENNAAGYLSAPAPLGQFFHVAATLDDATGVMRLYVNGTVAAQAVTAVRPFRDLDPASNPGVGIGSHGGHPATPHNFLLNALIDELAVYDRALTPGEVVGIHAAGGAGKIRTANYIAADFPVITEGPTGANPTATFTIRRVGNLSGQAVVNWATADGTATGGSDYVAASGQVVFADGESEKTVTITVNGDNTPEAIETFRLALSTTTPGYAAGAGWGVITDDDVGVSVADSTAAEGDGRIGQSLGAFVSQFDNGNMNRSSGMTWGPDGNLYVGSFGTNEVLRFDGTTGAFLGAFVTGVNTPAHQGLVFRPDGLYVLSRDAATVQRFDAATGAPLGTFIPSGSGGLTSAKGMIVGPDGNWYVSSGDNRILRYAGATGAFLGAFVAAGSGGLNNPRGMAFGPDGNLYVASQSSNSVLRYNGQTGAFLNAFVAAGSGGLSAPGEVLFSGGSLYVSSQSTAEVLRYNATTGAFLDDAVTAGLGGLDRPLGLLSDANNNLLVGSFGEILRYGPRSQAAFTVRLSIPSATPVTINYTTVNGTAVAGSDYTAVSGALTFAPGQTVLTVVVPILNDAIAENGEAFTLVLSHPIGATITNGTGVAAITDDDATKFFVVNDGSPDQTYRYGAPGNSQTTTSLGSGNTAPRGASSTAAGDKVWVVDANKTVYVYSAAGTLLGSWTAGSLAGNAIVEGITVWGNDVWLVDARQDRVYRYANAAGRLSGSQNATSNFALNSGNGSPKDLVTDGTSIWVVNDSTTDKVFKYTLSGSLLGSWTITAGGGSPTGITLDPTGASQDLWVVDNATDQVYQYAAARSLTSGSATASATFALAAGNTNPQGIADPPVPSGVVENGPSVGSTSVAAFWPTMNAAGDFSRGISFDRKGGDGTDSAAVLPVRPTPAADLARVEPFDVPAGELGWAVALDPSGLVRLAGTIDFESHPLDAFHLPKPSVDHPPFAVKCRQN